MKNKTKGFTLIEVLIALVIISVALTAIIKATSQNIRDTAYIQDKMIAHWVGLQAMNEYRAKITKSANQAIDVTMLGKEWRWKQTTMDTPNPNIKKIDSVTTKCIAILCLFVILSRLLLDALCTEFPIMNQYLTANEDIVHDPHFKSAVIKILLKNKNNLTTEEKNAVRHCSKNSENETQEETSEDDEDSNFAQRALKRNKIQLHETSY